MDAEWLEMEAAWKCLKAYLIETGGVSEGFDQHTRLGIPLAFIDNKSGTQFTFTRELNPDGRYKIICNGKRVVEQGETKPL
jgi:hypothetical protein